MRRPLGQIKYLKDAEDDCDLDLELTVADLLVDEGKALQDSSDQKRIVLVVVDQGRAVREGSVVPDLTPLHYQPTVKPPVPRFPGAEKRIPEEPAADTRPPKRRRLDQIEDDDGEEVVHSIEGQNGLDSRDRRSPSHFEVPGAQFLSALNTGNVVRAAADIKRESPGPQFWPNTVPATRDELELLPQQPENWQPQQRRTGLPPSRLRNSASDRETMLPHAQQSTTTPITPGTDNRIRQSPSANAINMLNGMKSVSPALRQSASSSTSRFRGPRKNVFDVPESDVEDSQMSPESKAGRKPITPRLVPTPWSVDTNSAAKRSFRSALPKKPVAETGVADPEYTHEESTLLPDGTEAMDRELPRNQDDVGQDVQMGNELSWEREGFSKLSKSASNQAEVSEDAHQKQTWTESKSSNSDEESTGASSRLSKKHASSREGRSSSGVASTSRSSSVASSASVAGRSTSSKSTGKKTSYARDRKTLTENEEDDTLDSPGIQLEETLRQSSPVPRKSTVSRSRTSASKTSVQEDGDTEDMMNDGGDEDEGDTTRPPESVSDFEEAVQPAKQKRTKRGRVITSKLQSTPQKINTDASGDLRCYTCWNRKRNCNNARPKCSACISEKKNCQIYDMTRESAAKEREDRKLGKPSKAAARPASKGSSSRIHRALDPQLSDEVVSASDKEDESEAEKDDEDDKQNVEKHSKPSKTAVPKPKAEPSRQKKKVDKKRTNSGPSEQFLKSTTMTDQSTESQADTDISEDESFIQQPAKGSVPQKLERGSAINQNTEAPDEAHTDAITDTKPATTSVTDLDTQCSVVSATGLVCTRQLACRLHGMATKRALPGRSQPFDVLLKRQQAQGKASNQQALVSAETKQSHIPIETHQPGAPTGSTKPAVVHEKSIDSASTHTPSARAPSIVSRVPPSVPIIPPGMTKEEYDRLMSDRSGLTEQEWIEMKKKLASRKSTGSQKDNSPLVVRSQDSQSSSQKHRKPTPSIKSDDKVTSSSQASKKQQAPASTQPEPNSHTFATATTPGPVNTLIPKSVPSKSDSVRQTATDARLNGRLKAHPVMANTAATLSSDKHFNPPYRQPLRKPLSSIVAPAAPQDLGTVRNLKALRSQLKSSGSGASTPQPQSVRDRLSGFTGSVQSKQGFKLADEEEEEDETESESEESPAIEQSKPKTPRFIAVNGIGLGNMHNRARQVPQDEDGESSESSDDDGWSK